MKAYLKSIFCLCLMLLVQVSSHAQQAKDGEALDKADALAELILAVGAYAEAYQNLRTSRGLVDPARNLMRLGAGPLPSSTEELDIDLFGVLRKSYPQGTGFIFYSFDDNDSYLRVWLITGDGIQAYHKAKVPLEKLATAISDLRNSLGVDSLQSTRYLRQRGLNVPGGPINRTLGQPFKRAVANLTEILLPKPVSSRLSAIKHLMVNPILGIGTVPFAILQPFEADAFLIERMSVSFTPSIYDLAETVGKWQPSFRRPLIVGNPYLPSDGKWIVPPLPGAEEEARVIAEIFGGTPVIGKEATKKEIVTRASEADFLYFGTHGVASSGDPLLGSFLAFSAPTLSEGFWTAKEVQSTKLKAQIAVLSACQTGLGQAHDAGTIGIARAFQIAGVPRVVMSLWSVNDRATAELMRSFGEHLRDKVPSEALRQAMLEVKKQRPDPSQWASFVLFGNPK